MNMNITFNNVNKKYGRKQTLRDINITIPEGISFTNKEYKFQIKSSKQRIPEVVEALLDRDIAIFEITPNKNLERIFLDLTDGDDEHVDTH